MLNFHGLKRRRYLEGFNNKGATQSSDNIRQDLMSTVLDKTCTNTDFSEDKLLSHI